MLGLKLNHVSKRGPRPVNIFQNFWHIFNIDAHVMLPYCKNLSHVCSFNTLMPEQKEQHFADDIFKWIFFKKIWSDFSEICSQWFNWQQVNSLWPSDQCHIAIEVWVNIGSGNGLLPDGTKSLPEPMLTNDQWGVVLCGIHLIAISHWQKICKIFIMLALKWVRNLLNNNLKL